MGLSSHEARLLQVLLDLKRRRESRILKSIREERERLQANRAQQVLAETNLQSNRLAWIASCAQGFSAATEELEKKLYSHYGKYHQYEKDRLAQIDELKEREEKIKASQAQLEAALRLNRAGQEKFRYLLEQQAHGNQRAQSGA